MAVDWLHFPSFTLPLTDFGRVMLMGDTHPDTEGPQVQALTQPCDSVIASHFHDVPQFQVIVGGSGIIGRHPMSKGMVRYVDRHRVYGPVRPNECGLVYLTLRREHDPGPFYMPESRDLLAERRPVDPRGLGFDMAALDTCWRVVAYRDADGLEVSALNLGRHEAMSVEMGGSGGFVVVIGGELESASAVSACWLPPGQAFADTAGQSGGRLLRLQFPTR
jgi:hypothetical protein